MSLIDGGRKWEAQFNSTLGDKPIKHREPVAFWVEADGCVEGYVLDTRGRFRRAADISNFDRYVEAIDPLETIIPANPGWCVVWKYDNGNWWEPVIGWAVDRYGCAPLVAPDADGAGDRVELEPDKVVLAFEPNVARRGEGPWPIAAEVAQP